MYTAYTYQDWQSTPETERPWLLETIIGSYKQSADFRTALDALKYFRGENPTVANKVILQEGQYSVKHRDENGGITEKKVLQERAIIGARLPASFLFRFVTQQNQYLLGNGVTLGDAAQKERLGIGFDTALAQLGEQALICGVSWGFWNLDHLEAIPAARDTMSGFVALLDEGTSVPMVGIQFWQVAADKPMHVRLFEPDGLTVYRKGKEALEVIAPKRAYALTLSRDAAGVMVTGESNYSALPVIPLYANPEKRSELTAAIRQKIDAYDRISSDFVDNLDKANDVYWVLNNFGGTLSDMAEMIDTVRRTGMIASISDGVGGASTAEPHAFEVPYQARQTALTILEKELYKDYMAVNMDEITGGSLTNVAIKTATMNLNLKADRYEWQVFTFVQQVLALLGIETEEIRFKRQSVVNDSEIIANIATMRQDIDQRTALMLNPYIDQERIDEIIQAVASEEYTGQPMLEPEDIEP